MRIQNIEHDLHYDDIEFIKIWILHWGVLIIQNGGIQIFKEYKVIVF